MCMLWMVRAMTLACIYDCGYIPSDVLVWYQCTQVSLGGDSLFILKHLIPYCKVWGIQSPCKRDVVFSIRLNEVLCTPLLVILVLVFRWVCIHAFNTSSCLGCLLLALHGFGWPGTKGPWRLVSDVVCDMWRWLVQGDRSPVFYEGLGVLVIASYSLCLLSYSYPVFLATCVPFIILVDCGTCSLIVRSVCVTTLDWGKGGTMSEWQAQFALCGGLVGFIAFLSPPGWLWSCAMGASSDANERPPFCIMP